MIATTEAIMAIRPISENLDQVYRIQPYLQEIERTEVLNRITANVYRWLDEMDWCTPNLTINDVTITEEQLNLIVNGGYYTAECTCKDPGGLKWCAGLIESIAYLSYQRFLIRNSINITAFGNVRKNGPYSDPLSESDVTLDADTAKRIGYNYLQDVVNYLIHLGILPNKCTGNNIKPTTYHSTGSRFS